MGEDRPVVVVWCIDKEHGIEGWCEEDLERVASIGGISELVAEYTALGYKVTRTQTLPRVFATAVGGDYQCSEE